MEAILRREEMGSTGLKNGLAVPHAKTKEVDSLVIATGISPGGIDYDSMDGGLSNLFFLLVSPMDEPEVYLDALSDIARLLKQQDLARELLKAKNSEDFLDILTGDNVSRVLN